jgi:hypothetical protein
MMRGRNTQSKMLQWEKILKVMLTGQEVNKESLEAMPEMKGVPLYRLSTFIWRIKVTGGVVKAVKNGRKISGYQLANIDEMQKYLDRREKVFADAAKKDAEKEQKKAERAAAKSAKAVKVKKPKVSKVTKLKDLNAAPVEKEEVAVDNEIEVVEITESGV